MTITTTIVKVTYAIWRINADMKVSKTIQCDELVRTDSLKERNVHHHHYLHPEDPTTISVGH